MKLLALSILAAAASPASAQPTNAILSWEFSIDNGSVWTPNSLILQSPEPTTVLVRALISWQSHTSTTDGFLGLNFDPFVQLAPLVGTNDWIVDPLVRTSIGLYAQPNISVRAFPDLLKVDRTTDLLLPGLGTGWLGPSQSLQLGGVRVDNPLTLLVYTYQLDGSLGTRTVSSALSSRADGTSILFFDLDFGISTPIYTPVTQLPATITVIPSPTPLATFLLGGLLTSRRRRN